MSLLRKYVCKIYMWAHYHKKIFFLQKNTVYSDTRPPDERYLTVPQCRLSPDLGLLLCRLFLSSTHRFFQLDLGQGLWQKLDCSFEWILMCAFGLLSYWKIRPWPGLSFVEEAVRLWFKIGRRFLEFILPCIGNTARAFGGPTVPLHHRSSTIFKV